MSKNANFDQQNCRFTSRKTTLKLKVFENQRLVVFALWLVFSQDNVFPISFFQPREA